MCLLALMFRVVEDAPLIVGANREEFYSRGGEPPQVLDGPFADTKEQLGGYYLIDVADLDAALSWASRCPAVGHGTVEVRPVWSIARSATPA